MYNFMLAHNFEIFSCFQRYLDTSAVKIPCLCMQHINNVKLQPQTARKRINVFCGCRFAVYFTRF